MFKINKYRRLTSFEYLLDRIGLTKRKIIKLKISYFRNVKYDVMIFISNIIMPLRNESNFIENKGLYVILTLKPIIIMLLLILFFC